MKEKNRFKWSWYYRTVAGVLDEYYAKNPYTKVIWLTNIATKCRKRILSAISGEIIAGHHLYGLIDCIDKYMRKNGYTICTAEKNGGMVFWGVENADKPSTKISGKTSEPGMNVDVISDIRATLERVARIESGIMALNASVNDIRKDMDEVRSHCANHSDGCEPSTVSERIPCDIKVMIKNIVKEACWCMNPCQADSIYNLEKYKAAIIVASNIAEYIGILKRDTTSKSRVNEMAKRFAIDSYAAAAVLEMPLDSLLNVVGLNKSLSIYQGYRDHVDKFNNLAQTLLGDDYNDEGSSE